MIGLLIGQQTNNKTSMSQQIDASHVFQGGIAARAGTAGAMEGVPSPALKTPHCEGVDTV